MKLSDSPNYNSALDKKAKAFLDDLFIEESLIGRITTQKKNLSGLKQSAGCPKDFQTILADNRLQLTCRRLS